MPRPCGSTPSRTIGSCCWSRPPPPRSTGSAAWIMDRYQEAKESHALLDYDDLIEKAGTLVGDSDVAAWVLYKLDNGIDHVLVDEAQDTNPAQWRIVTALADEFFSGEGAQETDRTVFAVGDEKQSIFSFQGADPEIFSDMCRHFADAAGNARRPFDTRAAQPLLPLDQGGARLRRRRVLRSRRGGRRAGSGRGASGAAQGPGGARRDLARRAAARRARDRALDAAPGPARLGRADRAPRQQDRGQDRVLDRTEKLDSKDRPIEPGDIMVLVRRRNEFVDELVNALKRRPRAGLGRRPDGAGRPAGGDGPDRARPLHAAAGGRSDSCRRPQMPADRPVRDTTSSPSPMRRGENTLWQELTMRRMERRPSRAAHGFLFDLLAKADFVPPFEFFCQVLGALGRPAQAGRPARPRGQRSDRRVSEPRASPSSGSTRPRSKASSIGSRPATATSSATWSRAATRCGS